MVENNERDLDAKRESDDAHLGDTSRRVGEREGGEPVSTFIHCKDQTNPP